MTVAPEGAGTQLKLRPYESDSAVGAVDDEMLRFAQHDGGCAPRRRTQLKLRPYDGVSTVGAVDDEMLRFAQYDSRA